MYIPRPIYPHPKRTPDWRRPTLIHPTGGLAGNWALDFMCPGGTLILAPQDCHITHFSGHDPKKGDLGGAGIYGWSTYFSVPDGWYFLTHQDQRYVVPGQFVRKGYAIGRVGHWPHDEGRSHTHLGFTHKKGKAESIKRIQKVAAGPFRPVGGV